VNPDAIYSPHLVRVVHIYTVHNLQHLKVKAGDITIQRLISTGSTFFAFNSNNLIEKTPLFAITKRNNF